MFQPIVVGLSSGTFLYVGVVELLAKDLADLKTKCGNDRDELAKLLLFVGGWAAMAVLALWT